MADVVICGDFGGVNKDGEMCGTRVVDGLCRYHQPQPEPEEPTTCGDFGGINKAGEPCGRRRREGPCPGHHPEDGRDTDSRILAMRERQDAFLDALVEAGPAGTEGNITAAARQAGIDRRSHYDWLERDPEYRQRYLEAREKANDYLRLRLHQRGSVGWEEPWKLVTHADGTTEILTRRRYSDRIALRLAEAHLPEHRRRLDVALIEKEVGEMSPEELLAETRRLLQELEGGAEGADAGT